MKKLLFIFLLFTGCRDQYAPDFNPLDASQIEGIWRGEKYPYWVYHFSDGVLVQSIFDLNVPYLVENYWAYKTSADTIFLLDIQDMDTARVYTVRFEDEDNAVLTDATNAVNITDYKIKRY